MEEGLTLVHRDPRMARIRSGELKQRQLPLK
jgi:hypothetical protein